jgi:hypothetical protein
MLGHQRGSGLFIVEQAAVPREIADQLRKLDPQLELRTQIDADWGQMLWRVYISQGDRPSQWLLDWREDLQDHTSKPRPLSSAIVDEVASMRRGQNRRPIVDPLAENDRAREREERDTLDQARDAAREAERTSRRSPVFHRSRALYQARCRARARGEKV